MINRFNNKEIEAVRNVIENGKYLSGFTTKFRGGDEVQKLYPLQGDFTQKTLLEEIDDNRKTLGFIRMELDTIHRTNNVSLIKLVEDMRLDIMLYDEISNDQNQEKIKNPISEFDVEEFDQSLELSTNNYLFLFAKNKQIVQASHNMISAGRSFRLNPRGGKFQEYYPLWLNKLILFCEDEGLERIDFHDFDKFRRFFGFSGDFLDFRAPFLIISAIFPIFRRHF